MAWGNVECVQNQSRNWAENDMPLTQLAQCAVTTLRIVIWCFDTNLTHSDLLKQNLRIQVKLPLSIHRSQISESPLLKTVDALQSIERNLESCFVGSWEYLKAVLLKGFRCVYHHVSETDVSSYHHGKTWSSQVNLPREKQPLHCCRYHSCRIEAVFLLQSEPVTSFFCSCMWYSNLPSFQMRSIVAVYRQLASQRQFASQP